MPVKGSWDVTEQAMKSQGGGMFLRLDGDGDKAVAVIELRELGWRPIAYDSYVRDGARLVFCIFERENSVALGEGPTSDAALFQTKKSIHGGNFIRKNDDRCGTLSLLMARGYSETAARDAVKRVDAEKAN